MYPCHRSRSNCARKRASCAPPCRHHGHRRKQFERISLTAYFRREPRPNINIQMLWEQKIRQSMNVNQPWAAVPNQMPHQAKPIGPPLPHPQGGGPQPRGGQPPPPPPVRPSGGPKGPGPHQGGAGHSNLPPNQQKGGGKKRGHHGSDSDSISSYSSSGSSRSEPSTSASSAPSLGYSLRGRHGHRNGSHGRSSDKWQERSKHRGAHNAPKHRRKQEKHTIINRGPPFPGPFMTTGFPPGPPPPPIRPVPSPSHVAAYNAGRLDAMDARAEEAAFDRARCLRPHGHVHPSRPTPMGRTFSQDRDDFPHRRDFDDDLPHLDSLSLDDEYDTDRRYDNARRRREFNLRRQNGSIMSEDLFSREPGPFFRR